MLQFDTEFITKCHLADCRNHTLAIQGISRNDLSGLYILKELAVLIHDLFIIRQIVSVSVDF